MSGTLQHPENCIGPKSSVETACPWAPSADPRIIYRSKPMKCTATTVMSRVSPVPQKGIPRLEPGAQGSSGAGRRDMCWRLLLFTETEHDGPYTWPRQGPMPLTNCIVTGEEGRAAQGTVPSCRTCWIRHRQLSVPQELSGKAWTGCKSFWFILNSRSVLKM